MHIRIFTVLIIAFFLLAPMYVVPTIGADGEDKYSPAWCANIEQKIDSASRSLKSHDDVYNRIFDEYWNKKKTNEKKLAKIQYRRRQIGCLFQNRIDKPDIKKCQDLTRERMVLVRENEALEKNWNRRAKEELAKRDPLYDAWKTARDDRSECEDRRRREKDRQRRDRETGWQPANVGIVPCEELPGWTVDSDVKCAKTGASTSTSPAPSASTTSASQTPAPTGTSKTQQPATSGRPPGCTLYKWKKCKCRC